MKQERSVRDHTLTKKKRPNGPHLGNYLQEFCLGSFLGRVPYESFIT